METGQRNAEPHVKEKITSDKKPPAILAVFLSLIPKKPNFES